MGQKRIQIEMTGQSALLMHAYPMEPIEALDKKPKEEQAEHAAYRCTDTNNLYVPGVAVQRALVYGAAYSKGKGRASLQKPAAACMMISPERIYLSCNGKDEVKTYEIDSRPVVIQATRGRIIRHRPRFDDWKISFTLDYDDTLLTEKQVRKIVDDTGSRVGFLDFRPQKNGPFGRSVVTSWKSV